MTVEKVEGLVVPDESSPWVSSAFPNVVVYRRGQVPALELERFAGAVGRLLGRVHVAGGARLRITADLDDGHLLVQVNLRVDGTPARIQTETRARGDALPVVVRLERLIARMRAPWLIPLWPGTAAPPLDTPGPGEVSRRKPVQLENSRPLEALAVMDAMDYDAHLFTDMVTRQDALVYRSEAFGLRVARQYRVPARGSIPPAPGPFTLDTRSAPTLTETGAVDWVCDHGLPFLFYTDPNSGRGHLLCRRYDTGLTLLTPTAAKSPLGRLEKADNNGGVDVRSRVQ